jgi:hypothetical protein
MVFMPFIKAHDPRPLQVAALRCKISVDGNVHVNTVEGFWSLLKRGISGVYHQVSSKHLQGYLDEYAFRYNHREDPGGMFNAFVNRIEKDDPGAAS